MSTSQASYKSVHPNAPLRKGTFIVIIKGPYDGMVCLFYNQFCFYITIQVQKLFQETSFIVKKETKLRKIHKAFCKICGYELGAISLWYNTHLIYSGEQKNIKLKDLSIIDEDYIKAKKVIYS